MGSRPKNAKQRRVLHYWFTILWFTVGLGLWVVLRNELWFVGFMSLYAIWITHLAGWAAETPVETEDVPEDAVDPSVNPPPPSLRLRKLRSRNVEV